jgi:hypothetical protein
VDRQPVYRDHDLGDELRPDVRARGGHRLCAVHRGAVPGGASRRAHPVRRGETMDSAGQAVLVSGLAVLDRSRR